MGKEEEERPTPLGLGPELSPFSHSTSREIRSRQGPPRHCSLLTSARARLSPQCRQPTQLYRPHTRRSRYRDRPAHPPSEKHRPVHGANRATLSRFRGPFLRASTVETEKRILEESAEHNPP